MEGISRRSGQSQNSFLNEEHEKEEEQQKRKEARNEDGRGKERRQIQDESPCKRE